MFTGIVEELGTITNMQQSGEAMKLTIHANKILSDVHLGDSIAINGICLTVTSSQQLHSQWMQCLKR